MRYVYIQWLYRIDRIRNWTDTLPLFNYPKTRIVRWILYTWMCSVAMGNNWLIHFRYCNLLLVFSGADFLSILKCHCHCVTLANCIALCMRLDLVLDEFLYYFFLSSHNYLRFSCLSLLRFLSLNPLSSPYYESESCSHRIVISSVRRMPFSIELETLLFNHMAQLIISLMVCRFASIDCCCPLFHSRVLTTYQYVSKMWLNAYMFVLCICSAQLDNWYRNRHEFR